MTPELTAASAQTDFSRFAGIKALAQRDTPAAYRQIGQEFEALFFQMMLKAARAGLPGDGAGDGVFGDSSETRLYQDLFDQQMAMIVGADGKLGLAEAMMRQLSGDAVTPVSPPGLDRIRRLLVEPPPASVPADSAPAAAVPPDPGAPFTADSTPAAFLARIRPYAEQTAVALGTQPEALMAQAALETGWGQQGLRFADGRDSFNIFGIKATPDWAGARVRVPTLEYAGGRWQRTYAEFRAYPDQAEAFADYLALIRDNPRYQRALGRDGGTYAQELQRAGYATDPDYATKIDSLQARVRVHLHALEAKAASNEATGTDDA